MLKTFCLPARGCKTLTKALTIMNITALLITVACLHVFANGKSQITLSVKDSPLNKVFKEIRKQSGFKFLYAESLLNTAGGVTLNVKDVSLNEAVKKCLEGKNLDYTILEKTVVIKEKVVKEMRFAPPPITVKGRVVDEEGKPVEGVTVTVKGSKTMAATNSNGEFTLYEIDDNALLIFSHTSIETQELEVKNRKDFNIGVKKKISPLDEVQFVAYGTNSPRFQTGNVASIKAKDIEKQPVNNPLLALQGRVPGLHITQANGLSGGGVVVRIQGQNSINNGNDPLYVIDGVPFF